MDLVVLGTSNCIISDSFVEWICPRTGVNLHNLSLGACTSSLGLYMLDEVPPSTHGLALIDFGLIDGWGVNVWGGTVWTKHVENNFKTIVIRLRSLNYTPV